MISSFEIKSNSDLENLETTMFLHEGLYCLIIPVNGFNTGSVGLGVSLRETLCTIQDILQPH